MQSHNIFSQNSDQVEEFCIARAYIEYAFWVYYDVSSFITDSSLGEKITYKSESLERLSCSLKNFEKSYKHWSLLDKPYANAFEAYVQQHTSLIDYAKNELSRNVKFDEDVELSKLLSYSNEELKASLTMIDILPVDHLDSLFSEVNKTTSVLFEDILLNIDTDDFESIEKSMNENYYALDESLAILTHGYKKYISQEYFKTELSLIVKNSKNDLGVFDHGSMLYKSYEDIRLICAAWHYYVFMFMLLARIFFEDDEDTFDRVNQVIKKGIPEAINSINALGFSMSHRHLSLIDEAGFKRTILDHGDIRSKIKQTYSFKKFFCKKKETI